MFGFRSSSKLSKQLGDKIGAGGAASVFKGRWRGMDVACKVSVFFVCLVIVTFFFSLCPAADHERRRQGLRVFCFVRCLKNG
jgi:hypothetical protein